MLRRVFCGSVHCSSLDGNLLPDMGMSVDGEQLCMSSFTLIILILFDWRELFIPSSDFSYSFSTLTSALFSSLALIRAYSSSSSCFACKAAACSINPANFASSFAQTDDLADMTDERPTVEPFAFADLQVPTDTCDALS